MSGKAKFAMCLAGAIAPLLLAMAGTASADEKFEKSSTISSVSTKSFDIGFVDPVAGVYVLADRTNKAIDVIDTSTNTLINQLKPGFVGAVLCPDGTANDCAGPDGVLIVNHTEVWVGDGNSTVWVLHLQTGKVIDKISTAIDPKDPTRADELCYDPNDHIILMANDASSPSPFVTFISSTSHAVLGRIIMDGGSGTGHGPQAAGIEQCQWSPRTGKFYINLPVAMIGATKIGTVLVIDPVSMQIERTWTIDPTKCTQPQGMAIGPAPQILLGCRGSVGSVIIDESLATATGPASIIHSLPGLGGNDEVWYNPGDNQYFLANTAAGLLGVADPDGTQDVPFATTLAGSHSVAADPVRNQVYVPFNDGTGIGVYTAVGTDDPSICVGQGAPVISMGNEGTGQPVLLRVVCPPKDNK
jgi:DNA-binding beta-propeller fold protein YncE